MSVATLRTKFDSLLRAINGTTSTNFSARVENAYEALVMASVMTEYCAVYGAIRNFHFPSHPRFLNQSPGKFRVSRAFKIEFTSSEAFYFAADVELFGLNAMTGPAGIKFEADVVVIPVNTVYDIINNFDDYPAPQHLDSIYECKFGSYNKGQLRELLGLKRHTCYLRPSSTALRTLFIQPIVNSHPPIALKMVRPVVHLFFDRVTADFYDLEQIIIN